MARPLEAGDEIRVIALSSSAKASKKALVKSERSIKRLNQLGYVVSIDDNVYKVDHFGTDLASSRAKALNEAYQDKNVKAILAFCGGWLANEIIPYLDWNIIKNNPKPLIGFSDITVLINAIYAKTKVTCFLGPNFSTFGKMTSWKYTVENFNLALKQTDNYSLKPSKIWTDYSLVKKPTRWKVINAGMAQGILIGGNIGTLYLLQGTDCQLQLNKPYILLAEDDNESGKYTILEFSRRLESFLQLPGARDNLKGIIIGRFIGSCQVTPMKIKQLLESKNLHVPAIAGVDFGHTLPLLTLPIGGEVLIDSSSRNGKIKILNYGD